MIYVSGEETLRRKLAMDKYFKKILMFSLKILFFGIGYYLIRDPKLFWGIIAMLIGEDIVVFLEFKRESR